MDPTLRGETVYHPFDIAWSNILQSHPPPGLDIRLTLDSQIQDYAFEILEGRPGAIVVFEPSSGNLLALISSPSFDSNSINQDWNVLTSRTDAPLLNRTTQSQYQPGMVFTPFIAAWGLDHDLIDLTQEIQGATNPYDIHGEPLECSFSPPDTLSINIALALRLGCPSYFAEFGSELGEQAYADIVRAFGFDEAPALRIDSFEPEDLIIPATIEELRLASIGQSTLTVTPIQVARAFGALINDGVMPAFRLVDAIENPDDGWEHLAPQDSPRPTVSPQVAEMILATSRTFGGGIQGFSFQAIVGQEQERLHWFLGVDQRDRAIVVLLESENLERAEEIGISILGLQ